MYIKANFSFGKGVFNDIYVDKLLQVDSRNGLPLFTSL